MKVSALAASRRATTRHLPALHIESGSEPQHLARQPYELDHWPSEMLQQLSNEVPILGASLLHITQLGVNTLFILQASCIYITV